jgi:hypothetical protein
MSIPESQLKRWSKRGAETTAKATHETIRLAISNTDWNGKTVNTYLQGSYRNKTNIRGDSDVDIVAELETVFYHDLSLLDEPQIKAFKSAYTDATYGWKDFHQDMMTALQERFGAKAVEAGNKCIKLQGENGRLPADVIVCLEFRRYTKFHTRDDQAFIPGIKFLVPSENRWVINYPKLHIKYGARKNSDSRTKGQYKRTVRIFKNARRYLVDQGELDKKVAPSYFLECLLYNVPDKHFKRAYDRSFPLILNWLSDMFASGKASNFICQNRQHDLFGNTPEQWSEENATKTITQLCDLWEQW